MSGGCGRGHRGKARSVTGQMRWLVAAYGTQRQGWLLWPGFLQAQIGLVQLGCPSLSPAPACLLAPEQGLSLKPEPSPGGPQAPSGSMRGLGNRSALGQQGRPRTSSIRVWDAGDRAGQGSSHRPPRGTERSGLGWWGAGGEQSPLVRGPCPGLWACLPPGHDLSSTPPLTTPLPHTVLQNHLSPPSGSLPVHQP